MASPADFKIILITRKTRLEELIARYHSREQARFYVEHLGADFGEYLKEHERFTAAKRAVLEAMEDWPRRQVLDRAFLPTCLFGPDDIVVALGQDGLVANVMKYLNGQPLIGINPDPQRHDGLLLPFSPDDAAAVFDDVAAGRRASRAVTMAKAALPDGQTLYAVNDLFIGPRSHTSARYEIRLGNTGETQSSSGVIVSTGFGATAWMKSIITGAAAVMGTTVPRSLSTPPAWDERRLMFAVREPFPSRNSVATLVFGSVDEHATLTMRSLMPENGVIFSDGIESDFLEFNAGAEVRIGIAERRGALVQ
ncbi:MAG: sugar kinase [Methylobacteriaceae bacterium]|jgi:NAD kinase|nr:sugar kinase [Methylobacteriaceae bacterium]